MFKKRKPSYEDLMASFTDAQSTYFSELCRLSGYEKMYDEAAEAFIKSKHAYEASLNSYIRFGGTENKSDEATTRYIYSRNTAAFYDAENLLKNQQKRVKKAERVYLKLQKLIGKEDDGQQMQ